MDVLTDYLYDPVSCGVYYTRLIVPIHSFKTLGRKLREYAANHNIQHPLPWYNDDQYDRLIAEISAYGLNARSTYRVEDIHQMVSGFVVMTSSQLEFLSRQARDICPPTVRNWIEAKKITHFLYGMYTHIWPLVILPETEDALHVDATFRRASLAMDITSLKSEGLERYKSFFLSIPWVGPEIKTIAEGRKHSSNYSLRIYPSAAFLWCTVRKPIMLPDNILKFLEGTLGYFGRQEWRTSIVFSAIVVESLLAEIYEEQFHKLAPDKPLGDLYYAVKEKAQFPDNIEKAITTTNQMRILAVHRSSLEASEREALQAIVGAVQFSLWHYSKRSHWDASGD